MALAKAEYEGLIDVVRRGPNRTAYRQLNVPALKLLRNQLPQHPDYIAEIEKRKMPVPMDYLELMDENTQIPAWISVHVDEWLTTVREHGSIKIQFANIYERDLASFALRAEGAEGLMVSRVEGSEADPNQQARRPKTIDKNGAKKAEKDNQRRVACVVIRDKRQGAHLDDDSYLMKITSPKPEPFTSMRDDDGDREQTFHIDQVDRTPDVAREKSVIGRVTIPEGGTDEFKSVAYQLALKLAEWRSDAQPDLARDSSILLPLAAEGVDAVMEVLKWSRTNAFWNRKLMEVGAKMLRAHFGMIRDKMTASRVATVTTVESPVESLEAIYDPGDRRKVIPFNFEEPEEQEENAGLETEGKEEEDDPSFPQQAPVPQVLSRYEKADRRRALHDRMNLPRPRALNYTPSEEDRRRVGTKASKALGAAYYKHTADFTQRLQDDFLDEVQEILLTRGTGSAERFIDAWSEKLDLESASQDEEVSIL